MFQTITVRAPSHQNILGAVKGPELPLLGQVGMLILILGSVVLMLILILMPPEGTALRWPLPNSDAFMMALKLMCFILQSLFCSGGWMIFIEYITRSFDIKVATKEFSTRTHGCSKVVICQSKKVFFQMDTVVILHHANLYIRESWDKVIVVQ